MRNIEARAFEPKPSSALTANTRASTWGLLRHVWLREADCCFQQDPLGTQEVSKRYAQDSIQDTAVTSTVVVLTLESVQQLEAQGLIQQ